MIHTEGCHLSALRIRTSWILYPTATPTAFVMPSGQSTFPLYRAST